MIAEADGDLERLMATVSPRAEYHFWSHGQDFGPKGNDGVREYYSAIVAGGANLIEFDVDRLIVDAHALVTEGMLKMLLPGATAVAMGMQVDDPAADYLLSYRQLLIWPIDENGLVLGEDSYTDGAHTLTPVAPADLPAAYRDRVRPGTVTA